MTDEDSASRTPKGCDPAPLFEHIWTTLVDLLGSPAAATLIRRCVKRAAATSPQLTALTISRVNLEYQYRVPASWVDKSPEAIEELHCLVHELKPVLVRLTGHVVLARLSSVPELRRCRLFTEELPS